MFKSFIQDFKTFAMRWNVVDLAVWVVIWGAFGKIVTSLVADIILPILNFLTGGINLTTYKIMIRPAIAEIPGIQKAVAEVSLNWWSFLQSTIDFIIIAFCIFLVVKAMAKIRRPTTPQAEDTKTEKLLIEIRDLLKK